MIFIVSETVADPGTAFASVAANIEDIDGYAKSTQQELRHATKGTYDNTANDITKKLHYLPDDGFNHVMRETGLMSAMDGIGSDTNKLNESARVLLGACGTLEGLETSSVELQHNFSVVSDAIEKKISNCGTDDCVKVLNMTAEFNTIDYTNIQVFQNQVFAFRDGVTELSKSVFDADNLIETARSELEDEVKKYTNDAIAKINSYEEEIDTFLKQTDDIFDKLNLSEPANTIKNYPNDKISNTDYYTGTYAAMLCLASILAAIAVAYILGLMYGACCPRPKMNRGTCCTRAAGSTCLKFGICLFFVFFWLVALVSLALLLTGGPAHTLLCRNIKDPSQSDFIDDLIKTIPDLNLDLQNVTVSNIYTSCKANESLYAALKFDQDPDYNLTTLINLNEIEKEIDKLKNKIIDFPGVNINTKDIADQAQHLDVEITALDSVLDIVKAGLQGSVTTIDLRELAQLLYNINDNETTTEELANQITSLAILAEQMEDKNMNVVTSINHTQAIFGTVNMTISANDIVAAVGNINTNGSSVLSNFVNETADEIWKEVETSVDNIISDVENEVGRCGVVYTSYNNIVHTACVEFLDAYNGVWFCLAWCLIFLLPTIFMASKLADLYSKTFPYVKNQTAPLDAYEETTLVSQPKPDKSSSVQPARLHAEPVYVLPGGAGGRPSRRSRDIYDDYPDRRGPASPYPPPYDPYDTYDLPEREPVRYVTRPRGEPSHYRQARYT